MEVNPNAGTGPAQRVLGKQAFRSSAKPSAADSVFFQGADAIGNALQQTPDVRPEAVQRARALTGGMEYPPLPTIRAISHLVASKLNQTGGEE
jgi:hypothetical protein